MKTALQILEGALTRLRRDGWCQHESMLPDGRVCITGSMIAELDMLHLNDGCVIQRAVVRAVEEATCCFEDCRADLC